MIWVRKNNLNKNHLENNVENEEYIYKGFFIVSDQDLNRDIIYSDRGEELRDFGTTDECEQHIDYMLAEGWWIEGRGEE